MHELSMARGLFKKLEEAAREKNLSKISKVVISVGAASGIDPHFLEHSLKDHLFPSTIFEKTLLEIKVSEPSLVCKICSAQVANLAIHSSESLIATCPSCGSSEIEIASGLGVDILEIL